MRTHDRTANANINGACRTALTAAQRWKDCLKTATGIFVGARQVSAQKKPRIDSSMRGDKKLKNLPV
jgi:hypothetical protein